jgi:hypothetical protein
MKAAIKKQIKLIVINKTVANPIKPAATAPA